MKKSLLTPLLYAAIMFLMIRLANDLPTEARYFSHSWQFIATELVGVIAGSVVCYHLARKWMALTIRRNIGVLPEYIVVILVPVVLCVVVMGMSHDVPLASELPDLVIPVVITALTSIWMYLTLKSQLLSRLYVKSILREKEAREARTETELKLLRSQFHPHFLFNMLNTIYFTIDETNTKARDTVEHLSILIRTQLYEGNGPVSIDREISALNSFLELCKVRYEESMDIISHINAVSNLSEIHPHLLLPLVENAVKHSGGNPRRIEVNLSVDGETLELSVKNTVTKRNSMPVDASGLGLTNLKKRLGILYAGRYELKLESNERLFKSYLKLKLQ